MWGRAGPELEPEEGEPGLLGERGAFGFFSRPGDVFAVPEPDDGDPAELSPTSLEARYWAKHASLRWPVLMTH